MGNFYSMLLACIVSIVLHIVFVISISTDMVLHGNVSGDRVKKQIMTVLLSADSKPAGVIIFADDALPVKSVHTATVPRMIPSAQYAVAQDKAGAVKEYFAVEMLDRKAVPVSNLDLSMLEEHYSGMPIRVRLYVNAYGQVDKVEEIEVLPEDRVFLQALQYALMHTKFIPAKMNATDVDSYQDIEFSFR